MAEPAAPTSEIGQPDSHGSTTPGGGAAAWSTFTGATDHVPELAWPRSIEVHDRMFTDGQCEALFTGTTLPIRQRVWTVKPNGAPANMVEALSEDLGLPVYGSEDDNVPMRPEGAFQWGEHLSELLLALGYGHYYFEQVGEYVPGDELWRLRKLAPRAPRTIDEFRVARDGGLHSIRQGMVGAGVAGAPVIPVERLVGYVWNGDARTRWIGKSMFRSLYRHWLVKDRLIRVDAINLERPSGAPILEAPEGAGTTAMDDLSEMAQQMKWGEHAGAAVPHGTVPHFPDGRSPDVVKSIRYHDEAMARAWMLMLLQLGQTETGSRALGGTFADYAALAVNAIAGWVAQTATLHVVHDWVRWNYGNVPYAPVIHQRERDPEEGAPPTTDGFVALVESGALTVNTETENWLRSRRGIPLLEGERPQAAPPQMAAAFTQARRGPDGRPAARLHASSDGSASIRLPERELRRQPYEHEVFAAVDYAQMEATFMDAMAAAEKLYTQSVIPAQIDEARDLIERTKAGAKRSRVTQADMAKLTISGAGRAELELILLDAAQAAAAEAAAELTAQGVAADAAKREALLARVADQAAAITDLAATGITSAAQRKAVQIAGGSSNATDVADAVTDYLAGLKHTWTLDQLQGAVTMAQNVGRLMTFDTMKATEKAVAKFYASELLDGSTCDECMAVDGTEYDTLDEAAADYPSGGYSECAGGPRCRGTVVVVADTEQVTVT